MRASSRRLDVASPNVILSAAKDLLMLREYFVYIATNHLATVLYTGITNDLHRRMQEHREKVVEGFTATYNVSKLVWWESFPSPSEAIAMEKRIKGWTRAKKVALVEQFNPSWHDLADCL
jgi:putative endonuclease